MTLRLTDEPTEYLTEGEAAQLLRLSVRTLQAWRVDRAGPPYTKLGKAVRYERRSVLAWAQDRAVSSIEARA